MEPIRSITFVVNTTKPGAKEAARYLAGLADCEGVTATITTEYPLRPETLKDQDLCCAIGGDGTLLGVLEAAIATDTPVLGVNLGKLGFLATFTQKEAGKELPALIQGNYIFDERAIFECDTNDGEKVFGLNDVVIKETDAHGLVRLQVCANGQKVSEYHCDGLIFATPTGSTAYNLSAGGPIIGPRVSAMAMTPICPHTLGDRSVIFADSTEISVSCEDSNARPRISIDGRIRFSEKGSLPLTIKVAPQRFRILQVPGYGHFATVRNKLNWGDPTIR